MQGNGKRHANNIGQIWREQLGTIEGDGAWRWKTYRMFIRREAFCCVSFASWILVDSHLTCERATTGTLIFALLIWTLFWHFVRVCLQFFSTPSCFPPFSSILLKNSLCLLLQRCNAMQYSNLVQWITKNHPFLFHAPTKPSEPSSLHYSGKVVANPTARHALRLVLSKTFWLYYKIVFWFWGSHFPYTLL